MDVTKKPQMHFKALKCHLEAKVKHVRRRSRHRLLLKPARLHPLGPQRMRGRAGAHAHRSSGAGPASPHSWQLQSALTHHLLSSCLGKVLIYTIDTTKVPQSWFLGRSHPQQAAEPWQAPLTHQTPCQIPLSAISNSGTKTKAPNPSFPLKPAAHSVLLLSPSSSGGRGAGVRPRPPPCSDHWRIRQRQSHRRHLCRR